MKIYSENVKDRIQEMKDKGMKQGEHFLVRRGKLYICDIPTSKLKKAWRLDQDGVSTKEIARILELDEEAVKRWKDT